MGEFVAERVAREVGPVLTQEGFDLVLVEYIPRSRVLRLFIDREGSEEGVTVDDCSNMSRLVSDVLDGSGVSESIDGRFTLEVSSPGLDRPLTRPKDFRRFVGQEVKLSTKEALDGRKRFRGKLVAADDEGIRLEVDGIEVSVGYGLVERARLVPDF